MSALTSKRVGQPFPFRILELTLAQGFVGFHNARVCFRSDGKVVPASSSVGLRAIGKVDCNPKTSIDASAADKTVSVDLEVERYGEWLPNATNTDAIAVTDLGKMAYYLDDQTVTITATGRSPAGRIWGVDTAKGLVLVETNSAARTFLATPTGGSSMALPAFAANDCAPTALEHDAVYALPVYTANSTVTLPATAADGTRVHFVNDGTVAFTIVYRDGTGNVALNAGTTASKRHGATAVKQNGKWYLTGLAVQP